MLNEEIVVNGNKILKKHFRAFVYGADGSRVLAKSWELYQMHLSSGIWFDSIESIPKKDIDLGEEEIAPEIIEKIKTPKKRGK